MERETGPGRCRWCTWWPPAGKEEHHETIDKEKLGGIMGTSKIQFLFFPPFVQGEGNEEAPGSKTGKVNDEVEVPLL